MKQDNLDGHKQPPEKHQRIKPRSLTNRARITNKLGLIPAVRGTSVWARRLHDLMYLHVSDMGGEDNCSQAELSIIRRASCLTVELEHLEQRFALAEAGATTDELRVYQMSANSLRRLLESIGLKRRAKDVTPTLDEYTAQWHAERAAAAEAETADEVEEVID